MRHFCSIQWICAVVTVLPPPRRIMRRLVTMSKGISLITLHFRSFEELVLYNRLI